MSSTRFFFQVKASAGGWLGSLMCSTKGALKSIEPLLLDAGFTLSPKGRYSIPLQETEFGVVDLPESLDPFLADAPFSNSESLMPWVLPPAEMGVQYIAHAKPGRPHSTVLANTKSLEVREALIYAGFKTTAKGQLYFAHPDNRGFETHHELMEYLYNATRVASSAVGIDPKYVMTTLKPKSVVMGSSPDVNLPVFESETLLNLKPINSEKAEEISQVPVDEPAVEQEFEATKDILMLEEMLNLAGAEESSVSFINTIPSTLVRVDLNEGSIVSIKQFSSDGELLLAEGGETTEILFSAGRPVSVRTLLTKVSDPIIDGEERASEEFSTLLRSLEKYPFSSVLSENEVRKDKEDTVSEEAVNRLASSEKLVLDDGVLGINILGEEVLDGTPRQVLTKQGFIPMELGTGDLGRYQKMRYIYLDTAAASEHTAQVILSAIHHRIDYEAEVTEETIRKLISPLTGGSDSSACSDQMNKSIKLAASLLNHEPSLRKLRDWQIPDVGSETEVWEAIRSFDELTKSLETNYVKSALQVSEGEIKQNLTKAVVLADEVGIGPVAEVISSSAINKVSYDNALVIVNRVKSLLESRQAESNENARLQGNLPSKQDFNALLLDIITQDATVTGVIDSYPEVFEYLDRVAVKGGYPFETAVVTRLSREIVGFTEENPQIGTEFENNTFSPTEEKDYSVLYSTNEDVNHEPVVRYDQETLDRKPSDESSQSTRKSSNDGSLVGSGSSDSSGQHDSGNGRAEIREQDDRVRGLGDGVAEVHASSSGRLDHGPINEVSGPRVPLKLKSYAVESEESILPIVDTPNSSDWNHPHIASASFRGISKVDLYLTEEFEFIPVKITPHIGASIFLGYNHRGEPLLQTHDGSRYVYMDFEPYNPIAHVDGKNALVKVPAHESDLMDIDLGMPGQVISTTWSSLFLRYSDSVESAFQKIDLGTESEKPESQRLVGMYLALSNPDFVFEINRHQGRGVASILPKQTLAQGLELEELVSWSLTANPKLLQQWVPAMPVGKVLDTARCSEAELKLAEDFTSNVDDRNELAVGVNESLSRIKYGDFDAPLFVNIYHPNSKERQYVHLLNKQSINAGALIGSPDDLVLNRRAFDSEVNQEHFPIGRILPNYKTIIKTGAPRSKITESSDLIESFKHTVESDKTVAKVWVEDLSHPLLFRCNVNDPIHFELVSDHEALMNRFDDEAFLVGKNKDTGLLIFEDRKGRRCNFGEFECELEKTILLPGGDILLPNGRSSEFLATSQAVIRQIEMADDSEPLLKQLSLSEYSTTDLGRSLIEAIVMPQLQDVAAKENAVFTLNDAFEEIQNRKTVNELSELLDYMDERYKKGQLQLSEEDWVEIAGRINSRKLAINASIEADTGVEAKASSLPILGLARTRHSLESLKTTVAIAESISQNVNEHDLIPKDVFNHTELVCGITLNTFPKMYDFEIKANSKDFRADFISVMSMMPVNLLREFMTQDRVVEHNDISIKLNDNKESIAVFRGQEFLISMPSSLESAGSSTQALFAQHMAFEWLSAIRDTCVNGTRTSNEIDVSMAEQVTVEGLTAEQVRNSVSELIHDRHSFFVNVDDGVEIVHKMYGYRLRDEKLDKDIHVSELDFRNLLEVLHSRLLMTEARYFAIYSETLPKQNLHESKVVWETPRQYTYPINPLTLQIHIEKYITESMEFMGYINDENRQDFVETINEAVEIEANSAFEAERTLKTALWPVMTEYAQCKEAIEHIFNGDGSTNGINQEALKVLASSNLLEEWDAKVSEVDYRAFEVSEDEYKRSSLVSIYPDWMRESYEAIRKVAQENIVTAVKDDSYAIKSSIRLKDDSIIELDQGFCDVATHLYQEQRTDPNWISGKRNQEQGRYDLSIRHIKNNKTEVHSRISASPNGVIEKITAEVYASDQHLDRYVFDFKSDKLQVESYALTQPRKLVCDNSLSDLLASDSQYAVFLSDLTSNYKSRINTKEIGVESDKQFHLISEDFELGEVVTLNDEPFGWSILTSWVNDNRAVSNLSEEIAEYLLAVQSGTKIQTIDGRLVELADAPGLTACRVLVDGKELTMSYLDMFGSDLASSIVDSKAFDDVSPGEWIIRGYVINSSLGSEWNKVALLKADSSLKASERLVKRVYESNRQRSDSLFRGGDPYINQWLSAIEKTVLRSDIPSKSLISAIVNKDNGQINKLVQEQAALIASTSLISNDWNVREVPVKQLNEFISQTVMNEVIAYRNNTSVPRTRLVKLSDSDSFVTLDVESELIVDKAVVTDEGMDQLLDKSFFSSDQVNLVSHFLISKENLESLISIDNLMDVLRSEVPAVALESYYQNKPKVQLERHGERDLVIQEVAQLAQQGWVPYKGDPNGPFLKNGIVLNLQESANSVAPKISADGVPTQTVLPISKSPIKDAEEAAEKSRKESKLFTLDGDIATGGAVTKFHNNVAAIELLKKIEANNNQNYVISLDEKRVLSEYVGWGGIPQAFKRPDGTYAEGWQEKAEQLELLLTQLEYKNAIASTTSAHFTSMTLIDGMYSALKRFGVSGSAAYIEPSVGTGNFIGRMPEELRKKAKLVAIEKDSLTGRIADQLYSDKNTKVYSQRGFEEYHDVQGSFDVAIGNPPYGSFKVFDPTLPELSSSIHNFFMLKSLHLLRAGGIEAFVVSRYFLDGENEDIRRKVAESADLLGAIRLPETAFKANAGTEVVADMIFLQKHDRIVDKSAMPSWVFTDKIDVPYLEDETKLSTKTINTYFIDNPEMVLGKPVIDNGMFSDMLTFKPFPEESLEVSLRMAISTLPENVYDPTLSVTKNNETKVIPENVLTGDIDKELINVSAGTMFNYDGKTYLRHMDMGGEFYATEVTHRRGSNGRELTISRTDRDRLYGLIEMRETFDHLLQLENSRPETDAELQAMETLRAELNAQYDRFTKTFGFINKSTNTRLVRQDNGFVRISALEKDYQSEIKENDPKRRTPRKESAVKADIFTSRVGGKQLDDLVNVETSEDALIASLSEYGRVDIGYMVELLDGVDEQQLMDELKDDIYLNPLTDEWEWKSVYLSGNVRKKLIEAEAHAATDDRFIRNVSALQDNQPEWADINRIGISFGAGWIEKSIYADFIRHLAKDTSYSPKITYLQHTGNWSFKFESNQVLEGEWATESVPFKRIISSAANNTPIKVFYKDTKTGRSILDAEASEKANQVKERLLSEFQAWCKESAPRVERLEELFNEKINTDIRVDIKAPKGYYPKGVISREVFEFREHQLDYIFRSMLYKETSAIHFAGAGKTASQIAATMERIRIGKVSKSLLVVPNHLVGQWAVEIQRLYPDANVLLPSATDFMTQNRQKLFARAASGNWDVVVIGESQVVKLPIDYTTQMELIDEEIDELEMALEAAAEEDSTGRSPTVKRVQKQLEDRKYLADVLHADSDNETGVTLQQMNFNEIVVDESQNFKNLPRATKLQVTGLGDTTGSKKCTSLMTLIRSIQREGGCTSFLSATPIANTIAEMHTFLKYNCPDKLAEKGALSFDGFISLFAEVETRLELAVTGDSYRLVDRLAKFTNLQKLLDMYLSVAHTVSPEKVRKALEKAGGKWFVPSMQGGKLLTVAIPKSPEQTRQFMEINARIERIKEGRVKPKDDNMLTALNDGRKASLHPMMYDSDDGQVLSGKLKWAVEYVAQKIEETEKKVGEKGLHIIFCDLGVPKGAKDREKAIVNQLIEQLDSEDESLAESASKELEKYSDDELRSILDESTFCFQDELRIAFEKAGVLGAGQMASMHDVNSEEERLDLFDRCNKGLVNVLFATSSKGGTGMNVSKCAAGVIDLDIPWRPDLLEQRHRRVLRQGNMFFENDPSFEVYVTCAVTEGSTDAWMLETVQAKAESMQGVIYGEIDADSISDVGVSPDDLASAKVTATGDDLIRRQYEASRGAKEIRIRINEIRDRIAKHERNEREFHKTLEKLPQHIDDMKSYMKVYDSYPKGEVKVNEGGKTKKRARLETVLPDGSKYEDAYSGGSKLLASLVRMMHKKEDIDSMELGTVNGVKLTADRYRWQIDDEVALTFSAGNHEWSDRISVSRFNVKNFGVNIKHWAASVENKIILATNKLKKVEKEFADFKLVSKPELDNSLYDSLVEREQLAAELMEEVNQARTRPVKMELVEAAKSDLVVMYGPIAKSNSDFRLFYDQSIEKFDGMLSAIEKGEEVSISDFDNENVACSMNLRSIKKQLGLSKKAQFISSLASDEKDNVSKLASSDDLKELLSNKSEDIKAEYNWLVQDPKGKELYIGLVNMLKDTSLRIEQGALTDEDSVLNAIEVIDQNTQFSIDQRDIARPVEVIEDCNLVESENGLTTPSEGRSETYEPF